MIRHAHDECKSSRDYTIRDGVLTSLGRLECAKFSTSDFNRKIQEKAELILTSPQRRALSTTLLALPDAVKRLLPQSRVILVPQLQGTSHHPCHRGLRREKLEAMPEYTTELEHGSLDFSPLTPDWNKKSGIYGSSDAEARARTRWLYDFIRNREEETIIMVAHGSIMRYFVAQNEPYNSIDSWRNVELRAYKLEWDGDVLTELVRISDEIWLGWD
ncbi:Histidine phosphatase family containing protein [Ceratobasidium theobromae]|uniref:Histidine phosphatase family containing protein n=1 Tax=Ceratobasidium theobromae TaxID=1582974 RepID=A0A5N5Q9E4_9AGAM|nr:Histidine phosphatase family containing protein [Ceratobasidium theobromae]